MIMVDPYVLLSSSNTDPQAAIGRIREAVKRFARYTYAADVEFKLDSEVVPLNYQPVPKLLLWQNDADSPTIQLLRLPAIIRAHEQEPSLIVRASGMLMFFGDFNTDRDRATYLLEINAGSVQYPSLRNVEFTSHIW